MLHAGQGPHPVSVPLPYFGQTAGGVATHLGGACFFQGRRPRSSRCLRRSRCWASQREGPRRVVCARLHACKRLIRFPLFSRCGPSARNGSVLQAAHPLATFLSLRPLGSPRFWFTSGPPARHRSHPPPSTSHPPPTVPGRVRIRLPPPRCLGAAHPFAAARFKFLSKRLTRSLLARSAPPARPFGRMTGRSHPQRIGC
jgi:hypothetical protein